MTSIDTLRVLWHPKDDVGSYYEDAAAHDISSRRFAVADGVSSAIFSNIWAKVLVESSIAGDVPIDDPDAFVQWLTPLRREWQQALPVDMNEYTLRKLQETRGGHATLLGLSLLEENGVISYQAYSIGDCCLFVFSDGKLSASFPANDSAYFGITPKSLPSSRMPRESYEPEKFSGILNVGDTVVLATDAIACWMFSQMEAGKEVDLAFFSQADSLDWTEFVKTLRDEDQIRIDDTTILIFRIGEGQEDSDPVEIEPTVAEEAVVEEAVVEEAAVDVEEVVDEGDSKIETECDTAPESSVTGEEDDSQIQQDPTGGKPGLFKRLVENLFGMRRY
jgi:hypothetical protein